MSAPAERRAIQQPHHHGGGCEHAEPGVAFDQAQHLRRLEAAALGDHVVGALGDEGERVEARAVGERCRVEHAIGGRDPVEVGEIAQCHHQQIAMRDGGALGSAGGAAGVEEPGGVVRPSRRGVRRIVVEHCAVIVRTSDERRREPRHLSAHALDAFRVALVGDAEPGSRIAEDVGDLARVQLGVDGDRDEARVPDAEQRLEIVRPVRHDDRHPIAGSEPVTGPERARDRAGAPVELAVARGNRTAEGHRRPFGQGPCRLRQQRCDVHC